MVRAKAPKRSRDSGKLSEAKAHPKSKICKTTFRRTGKPLGPLNEIKSASDMQVEKLKTSMSLAHLDTIQELHPDSGVQLNKIYISKLMDSGIKKQSKRKANHNNFNGLLTINSPTVNEKDGVDGFKTVDPNFVYLNNIQNENLERFPKDSQKKQNLGCDLKSNQIVDFNDSHSKTDNYSDHTVNINIIADEQGLTMLGSVCAVLKDLFLLNFASQYDRYLNYAEIAVLSTVLEKKFNTQLPVKNIYSLNDFKYLSSVQSTKRPEESYKFVFKYAFKNLKERFCEAKNIDISTIKKPEVFNLFYYHYFGNVSEKCGISIESFYLPLTPDTYGLDLNSVVAKTINSTYVRLIIKSKPFLTDFMEFVNEKFRKDYIKLVPKKIDNMIDKLEHAFESAWYNDRYIDVICDNIRSNKRCKLPWTVKELDYAIRQTNKLISKNLSKNNK